MLLFPGAAPADTSASPAGLAVPLEDSLLDALGTEGRILKSGGWLLQDPAALKLPIETPRLGLAQPQRILNSPQGAEGKSSHFPLGSGARGTTGVQVRPRGSHTGLF